MNIVVPADLTLDTFDESFGKPGEWFYRKQTYFIENIAFDASAQPNAVASGTPDLIQLLMGIYMYVASFCWSLSSQPLFRTNHCQWAIRSHEVLMFVYLKKMPNIAVTDWQSEL